MRAIWRHSAAGTSIIFLLASAVCGFAQTGNATANRLVSAIEKPAIQFRPMTDKERLKQYFRRSFGPEAYVRSAAGAGFGQWRDRPEEWGQGTAGFARRFASGFGEQLTETSLEFGVSRLLQEDNRYFVSQRTGFVSRTLYAIESPFMARHNDGSRHISFSHITAVVGAAMISRAWQPPSTRGIGTAEVNAITSLSVSMGFDVAREFWPRK